MIFSMKLPRSKDMAGFALGDCRQSGKLVGSVQPLKIGVLGLKLLRGDYLMRFNTGGWVCSLLVI